MILEIKNTKFPYNLQKPMKFVSYQICTCLSLFTCMLTIQALLSNCKGKAQSWTKTGEILHNFCKQIFTFSGVLSVITLRIDFVMHNPIHFINDYKYIIVEMLKWAKINFLIEIVISIIISKYR